jgi:hypothetical protein
MPSNKPRVVVYLADEDKAELDQWAKEEKRTVNNVITILIEQGLEDRRAGKSTREALQFALEFIETLIAGQKPGLALIAKLAHETDLTEEDLLKLRDRLTQSNGGKAKNGT